MAEQTNWISTTKAQEISGLTSKKLNQLADDGEIRRDIISVSNVRWVEEEIHELAKRVESAAKAGKSGAYNCPFCGGLPDLKEVEVNGSESFYMYLECLSCGARTKALYHDPKKGVIVRKTLSQLISMWNKRVNNNQEGNRK